MRLGILAAFAASAFSGWLISGRMAGPLPQSGAKTVTVESNHLLNRIPATAVGVNAAVWDGHLLDSDVPSDLRAMGVKIVRYPGGSTSDVYHWKTNSITPGQSGYANPDNTFDHFMKDVVEPARAMAMVTVNYGSNAHGTGGGSPTEAAAWVRYARLKRYPVRYWEIGNELYGNGYYGAQWETDLHRDHSPAEYAAVAREFARAMRRADRSIEIGLVLAAPGSWPDGRGPEQWNPTVLSRACSIANFVSVHWYPQNPGQEADAQLLNSPYRPEASSGLSVSSMASELHAELRRYCGRRAGSIQIMVTETNSVSSNPGKQTTSVVNGLFLIEDYLEWLRNGVSSVSWWDLHNGANHGNDNSKLAGSTDFGDYGVLSSGDSPTYPVDAPFPTATALRILHKALRSGGGRFVRLGAEGGLKAYALRSSARLSIVLVNPGATLSVNALIEVKGASLKGTPTASSFSLKDPRLGPLQVTARRSALRARLPPYSASVVETRLGG